MIFYPCFCLDKDGSIPGNMGRAVKIFSAMQLLGSLITTHMQIAGLHCIGDGTISVFRDLIIKSGKFWNTFAML